MSPEVVQSQPYDFKVDVWALGIILFEILSFKRPFNGRNKAQYHKQICNRTIPMKANCWKKVSAQAKDLIRKMTEKDPEKRISVQDAI